LSFSIKKEEKKDFNPQTFLNLKKKKSVKTTSKQWFD